MKKQLIEEFFKNLEIENQYYSVKLKQPVFLIGEKKLYDALKKAAENIFPNSE